MKTMYMNNLGQIAAVSVLEETKEFVRVRSLGGTKRIKKEGQVFDTWEDARDAMLAELDIRREELEIRLQELHDEAATLQAMQPPKGSK